MRIKLAALIPALNEEAVIKNTLESLLAAGMPPTDIYLINDGSKDRTAEIAASLGVNVFSNPTNLGKARSVTRILAELHLLDRYTHISFLDADTVVDRGYFSAVRARLTEDLRKCEKHNEKRLKKKQWWKREAKPIGVLCGRAKSIPRNWITAFRAYEYWLTHNIHKPAQAKMKVIMVAPGCASTYRVEALRLINWSNDTRTEDMCATIQAALAGERIDYVHGAVVYTQDPDTVKGYVNQLWRRWYAGTWQVMRKHNLLWGGPFSRLHWECRVLTLEPLFYIFVLVKLVLKYQDKIPWTIGSAFLSLMAIAIISSLAERRRDIFLHCWTFPIILFVNLLLFVGASWNLFTGRKRRSENHAWYKPERYVIETQGENR